MPSPLTAYRALRDARRKTTLHSCTAELQIGGHPSVDAFCTLTYAKTDPLAVLLRFIVDGQVEKVTVSREDLAAVVIDGKPSAGQHRVTVLASSQGRKQQVLITSNEGDGALFLHLPWKPVRRAVQDMYRWISDEQASALIADSFDDLLNGSGPSLDRSSE